MLKRKSLRLAHYDYHHPAAYFVTLVSHRRRHYFGEITEGKFYPNPITRTVLRCWYELSVRFSSVQVGELVVMPNHLHGILWITQGNGPTLGTLIALFKGSLSKQVRTPCPLWQRGFYDRVIRDSTELNNVRAYIRDNPLQWELDRLNRSG